MSDNVPFLSKEFLDFAKEYEFTTEPSSREYAQSNGKVENAVKTAKRLMKTAAESGNDFCLMLLEWRNTPSEDNSPSQRMLSRRAKILLPIFKKLHQPKLVIAVQEKLRTRKQIQSKYYNRGTKELNTLRKDDVVWIQPGNNDRTGRWTKGCVIYHVGVRSYNVKTEDGRIFRGNRKFLPHTSEPFDVLRFRVRFLSLNLWTFQLNFLEQQPNTFFSFLKCSKNLCGLSLLIGLLLWRRWLRESRIS